MQRQIWEIKKKLKIVTIIKITKAKMIMYNNNNNNINYLITKN